MSAASPSQELIQALPKHAQPVPEHLQPLLELTQLEVVYGRAITTMLRYGIDDLRLFYDGDLRFLKQFA